MLVFLLALFAIAGIRIGELQTAAAGEIRTHLSRLNSSTDPQVSVNVGLSGGLFHRSLDSVTINAQDFSVHELPFSVVPKIGEDFSISELNVHLAHFRLGQVLVESMVAQLPGCRGQLRVKSDPSKSDSSGGFHSPQPLSQRVEFRLTRSGLGDATVVVTRDSLADYIHHKAPGLKDLHLILGAGRFVLSGKVPLLGSILPFVFVGVPEPAGNELNLKSVELTINGISAKPSALKTFELFINPVFNLDRDLGLRGSTTMTNVRFWNEKMTVNGHVRLPSENSASELPKVKP